ncbi:MAG: hypothetical protein ACKO6L_10730 [Flavobacteriales bacterium]
MNNDSASQWQITIQMDGMIQVIRTAVVQLKRELHREFLVTDEHEVPLDQVISINGISFH